MSRSRTIRDFASAVLISAATLAQAWINYRVGVLGGEVTRGYQASSKARTLGAQLRNTGTQLRTYDAQLFGQFVAEFSNGNKTGAKFLLERFRPAAKKAMDTWLAMKPLKNPDAPKTPFKLGDYQIDEERQADELMSTADAKSEESRDLISKQDRYSALAVLFTAVLFFCGIATSFETHTVRDAMTGAGGVIFVGALILAFVIR